jgi:hypothetical protein
MIGGILQRLKKQRVEGVLIATYGHCNFGKLARAMTEQARLHASVVAIETFVFHPKLAVLRESQISQSVLDSPAGSHFSLSSRSRAVRLATNHKVLQVASPIT